MISDKRVHVLCTGDVFIKRFNNASVDVDSIHNKKLSEYIPTCTTVSAHLLLTRNKLRSAFSKNLSLANEGS